MTLDEIKQWGQTAEVSDEIAIAIHNFCEGNEQMMNRIWEDPIIGGVDKTDVIMSAAWAIADKNETEMTWGLETFKRS